MDPFTLKNNNKEKEVTTGGKKQEANILKKSVLGSYCCQIFQSKVNSF